MANFPSHSFHEIPHDDPAAKSDHLPGGKRGSALASNAHAGHAVGVLASDDGKSRYPLTSLDGAARLDRGPGNRKIKPLAPTR